MEYGVISRWSACTSFIVRRSLSIIYYSLSLPLLYTQYLLYHTSHTQRIRMWIWLRIRNNNNNSTTTFSADCWHDIVNFLCTYPQIKVNVLLKLYLLSCVYHMCMSEKYIIMAPFLQYIIIIFYSIFYVWYLMSFHNPCSMLNTQ